jgi:choline dehydrogenase-like flavoprotein
VSIPARFPAAADTIVVGAGTAGAAVAGRLAAGSSGRTLLLEAGPDYGPAGSGRWPHDLLDATSVTSSHDWGYTGEFAGQVIRFGRETRPGPQVSGRQAVERFIAHAAVHYYHPAGSCKMGPASDPDAVAGADGRVHGIEGLYVADASLMPAVTSGNTNMPTAVIGERIARSLLGL